MSSDTRWVKAAAMSNEQFLQSWEQEKLHLAALGHEWSLADAFRFSIQVHGRSRGNDIREESATSDPRNAAAA
jgi:hypothetical protein